MTFAFDNERYTNNRLSAIWLYDATLNTHTNLLRNNYEFTPNSSHEDNRFYITIEFDIPTDIDEIYVEDKHMIFDILGRRISDIHSKGVYITYKDKKYIKVIR